MASIHLNHVSSPLTVSNVIPLDVMKLGTGIASLFCSLNRNPMGLTKSLMALSGNLQDCK